MMTTTNRGRRQRIQRRRPQVVAALWFLLPALALLSFLRLLPVVTVAIDSFQFDGSWVGFENYRFLFSDEGFRDALLVTLKFNAIVNPLQIGIAFLLALALTSGARGRGIWSTLNLLPVTIPVAVSAMAWGMLLRPDNGIVNAILVELGFAPQGWFTSSEQALWSIVILASWVGVGYWSLFLVAGLLDIPESVTEAAAIDGAGYWRTLFQVRLPLMIRPLAFVLVADTVVNFLLFAPVQILTRGGPDGSTNLAMFDIYRNAFVFNDLSLAAAETVLLIAVVLMIVTVQFLLLSRQSGDLE
jgi:multiple sugar transport system permease protein